MEAIRFRLIRDEEKPAFRELMKDTFKRFEQIKWEGPYQKQALEDLLFRFMRNLPAGDYVLTPNGISQIYRGPASIWHKDKFTKKIQAEVPVDLR